MASGTRICKICGAEYPYCKTANTSNLFRWQDVACCPEHGAEYFSAILASRSQNKVAEVVDGDIVVNDIKPKTVRRARKRVEEQEEIQNETE